MIPALCPSHLTKLDDDDEFITIWVRSLFSWHIISQWSSLEFPWKYRCDIIVKVYEFFTWVTQEIAIAPKLYIFFFALVLNSRFPWKYEKILVYDALMRSQLRVSLGIDIASHTCKHNIHENSHLKVNHSPQEELNSNHCT